MGRIKENVACKQSCKLGRWKNTCSEKNQSPHENKVCNWQNCSSLQFGTKQWGKQQHTATPQIKNSQIGMSPQSRVGPLVLRGMEGKKHRLSDSQSLLAGGVLREGCAEGRSGVVNRELM